MFYSRVESKTWAGARWGHWPFSRCIFFSGYINIFVFSIISRHWEDACIQLKYRGSQRPVYHAYSQYHCCWCHQRYWARFSRISRLQSCGGVKHHWNRIDANWNKILAMFCYVTYGKEMYIYWVFIWTDVDTDLVWYIRFIAPELLCAAVANTSITWLFHL